MRRTDGAERWIALHGRRLGSERTGEGRHEVVGMARDVTSRAAGDASPHAHARGDAPLQNLLSDHPAMARQTVTASLTAAEFEARFSLRLKGLAISHDLLAARDWHGAPIGDLVRWHVGSASRARPGASRFKARRCSCDRKRRKTSVGDATNSPATRLASARCREPGAGCHRLGVRRHGATQASDQLARVGRSGGEAAEATGVSVTRSWTGSRHARSTEKWNSASPLQVCNGRSASPRRRRRGRDHAELGTERPGGGAVWTYR